MDGFEELGGQTGPHLARSRRVVADEALEESDREGDEGDAGDEDERGDRVDERPDDDEDEEVEDLFVIGERDTINIETQLRDAIVPLVDPRPLCSEDCAGLCDVCGEKWADLPSDHEHFVVDPRLASLASLLGDDAELGRS